MQGDDLCGHYKESVPLCPKCGSRPAYTQEGFYHCIKCGKDWPVNQSKKQEVIMSSKRATCANCERPNMQIVTADGLCYACYSSGQKSGHEKGTVGYLNALHDAKERLTNTDAPPLLRGSAAVKAREDSEKDAEKPEKQMSENKQIEDVLKLMFARRHELMEEVIKLNETITMIEKYSKAA